MTGTCWKAVIGARQGRKKFGTCQNAVIRIMALDGTWPGLYASIIIVLYDDSVV